MRVELKSLRFWTISEVQLCVLSFDVNVLVWSFDGAELDTLQSKGSDEGLG